MLIPPSNFSSPSEHLGKISRRNRRIISSLACLGTWDNCCNPKTLEPALDTASRKSLYHQRVANGTVRNCLRRIGIGRGLLCLGVVSRAERMTRMRVRSSFSLSQYNGIPTTRIRTAQTMITDSAFPNRAWVNWSICSGSHAQMLQNCLAFQSLFLCPGS